jgi:hypothetical protein
LDHGNKVLSERQRKGGENLLLDAGPGGFEGGMSTKKYEKVIGTSRATASRELIDLLEMGLLEQVGAGRSTRCCVALPGWGVAANRWSPRFGVRPIPMRCSLQRSQVQAGAVKRPPP